MKGIFNIAPFVIIKILLIVMSIFAFITIIGVLMEPIKGPAWSTVSTEINSIRQDILIKSRTAKTIQGEITKTTALDGIFFVNKEDIATLSFVFDENDLTCLEVKDVNMYILAFPCEGEGFTWTDAFKPRDFGSKIRDRIETQIGLLKPLCLPVGCPFDKCKFDYKQEIPKIRGDCSSPQPEKVCVTIHRTGDDSDTDAEGYVLYGVSITEGECQ